MKQPTHDGPLAWHDWLVMVLIMGYLSMSRSFAHLGIRPFYIGETAFLLLVLCHGRAIFAPWLALVQPKPLSSFSWWLYLSLGFGALEAIRGLLAAPVLMMTVQTAAFHFYPLFFFIGLWIGGRRPGFLTTTVRAAAWWQALYGMTYMLFLYRFAIVDPVTGTRAFLFWATLRPGAADPLPALPGIKPRTGAIPLLANSLLLLGLQVRAAWFSFMVSLPLWSVLSGRVRQMMVTVGLLAGVLILAFVTDVRLPSPARGGDISARSIVARAVAAADPALAAEIAPDYSVTFTGTISWRQDWWRALWGVVHARPWSTAPGTGLWLSHLEIQSLPLPGRTDSHAP